MEVRKKDEREKNVIKRRVVQVIAIEINIQVTREERDAMFDVAPKEEKVHQASCSLFEESQEMINRRRTPSQ